jgi:hypothetical protein
MSKHRSKAKNPPIPKDVRIPSEREFERIESDPEFRRMMRQSEEGIRAGRFHTRKEVDDLLSERSHRRHALRQKAAAR